MSESSCSSSAACGKHVNPKLKLLSLAVGVVGLAVAYIGLKTGLAAAHSTDHHTQETAFRPMYSLLVGSGFWFTVLIGMLMLTMITRVFDGGWAPIIRRQWENFILAIPVVFILGVLPLVLIPDARTTVWEWMNPEHVLPSGIKVAADPILAGKSWFLNETFFSIRIALYIVVFTAIPFLLRHWSVKQDRDPNVSYTHKAHGLSTIGILICALGLTFTAVDLFMALNYHWFSTMYGVWFFAASIRASLAMTVIVCGLLGWKGWLRGLFHRAHRHLLGCLMLAFTVFWAYISFSQYFIIYNANLPEETFWYNMREFAPHVAGQTGKNQWWYVSMGLVFLHFLTPFITLLFYKTKVHAKMITGVAVWILTVGFLDLYWNIVPRQMTDASAPDGYFVNPVIDPNMVYDAAAVIGLGGIVFAIFLQLSSKSQPIPVHDPRIIESVSYHE